MSYFLLVPDNTIPFIYGDAKFSPVDQGVYSNLWNDRALPKNTSVDICLAKSKVKLNRDVFSVNAGFVGSERLVEVLTRGEFKTKVNPVPANVFYHTGELVDRPYFFLEFDCWVDAFDYEASRYRKEVDGAESRMIDCERMVVDAGRTKGFDWFFLKGAEFVDPVVSVGLASRIKSGRISGLHVMAMQDYTWQGL